jgi:hypothetical protein
MKSTGASGYSLAELAVTVGVVATVAAISVPAVGAGLDEARTAGAARYLAARLADTRMEAIQRSTEVAMRFASISRGYTYAVYADGNHNGVLARDVQDVVDLPIRGEERLSNHFRNVEFGTLPGLPAIDAGGTAPGTDPIRCGTSNSLSFSPLGTSSSGTVYLLGRSRSQYAVRVFGGSGKIRVYRFDWRSNRWSPL